MTARPSRPAHLMRALFVYHPYYPDTCRLETMPFALNVLNALIDEGFQMDLMLWQDADGLPQRVIERAHIHSFTMNRYHRALGLDGAEFAALKLGCIGKFSFIAAVGAMGLVRTAGFLRGAAGSLSLYLNDEFPSYVPRDKWSARHLAAARRVAAIAVPDEIRAGQLRRELELEESTPIFELPNCPAHLDVSGRDFRAELGLPAHARFFLFSGALADHMQFPEILSSVPSWPADHVLVINGRTQEETAAARRTFSHLDLPGRVYWTQGGLSEPDLHRLIRDATGAFALYRNSGPNLELVGLSSGKLSRSIALGTPVIASRLGSLAFVEAAGIGVCVRHPVEIAEALRQIECERASMSECCRRVAAEHLDFSRQWTLLRSRMPSLAATA